MPPDDLRDADPYDADPEDADPGLARERTRMAWARTAIAFAALGVVVLRKELVIGLIVLVAGPLVWGVGHFASHRPGPEPSSRRLLLVTVIITAVSLLAAVAALIGHAPTSLDQLLPQHG